MCFVFPYESYNKQFVFVHKGNLWLFIMEKLVFCLRHKPNFLEFTARLAMNMSGAPRYEDDLVNVIGKYTNVRS